MKMKTHSVYIRMMSLLLAVLCIVGLFPASALAASPNTIKLEDCTYNGVHYDSPALGICYMQRRQRHGLLLRKRQRHGLVFGRS